MLFPSKPEMPGIFSFSCQGKAPFYLAPIFFYKSDSYYNVRKIILQCGQWRNEESLRIPQTFFKNI
ncbi:hypothetical protein D7Y09_11860 [bacterium 1XD42-1]|nr:hypothetical protein D7X25_10965 [bacterium 1XD42-8]RKJ63235.1 hypothetical protein D7Y09_11860 [bacterium 1XD42-1]